MDVLMTIDAGEQLAANDHSCVNNADICCRSMLMPVEATIDTAFISFR